MTAKKKVCDFCKKYGYPVGVFGHDVQKISISRLEGKNKRERLVCDAHRRVLKNDGYRLARIP